LSFKDFHGNSETVNRLRDMIGQRRFPHAVILAGPDGAGKYTLAQMVAKAMNCTSPPSGPADFCGTCANCVRIAQADDIDARVAEAVEAREGLRETDKKETRILIQTHPDVMAIPPDPPQNLIKIGQVRRVIESIHYKPAEARRKVYIFTQSAFMKEAANSLLKILEEPPDYATIFLLARNAGELLPTIRSRSVTFTLAALSPEEIEKHLAAVQPGWTDKQRKLVSRLSGGAIGKAQTFDLDAYSLARKDALLILQSALGTDDHGVLFHATETYRAGAEGKDKTDSLIRAVYSLLQDLVYLKSGSPHLVRNADVPELARLAQEVSFDWITSASRQLGQVESGMRRNLLRSLSLDAFAVGLER
jgi:DNA polymerase-3 subunit delta'